MITRIDIRMSVAVRAALDDIGRTEDVRFSPDSRLLAIAGFASRRCLILKVEIEPDDVAPGVRIVDFMTLSSDRMKGVHGIDFIDGRTIAVANRKGPVSILDLPDGELAGRHVHLEPLAETTRRGLFGRIRSPGSVAVRHEPDGTLSLLVCDNYADRVTRHVLDPGRSHRVTQNGVMLSRGLHLPDGIAISADGRWIAISNHDSQNVALYPAAGRLNRWSRPACLLRGPAYPHGLRFTADGAHLLVADAGAPVVHVFERGGEWAGTRDAVRRAVVLDDETFERGRINPQEGGPKGLDIDPSGRVVALTCDEMPLALFRLDAFVGDGPAAGVGAP